MSKNRRPSPSEQKPRLPRWRRVLILLSLVGFWAFFVPLFAHILNLANLAAMGGFLLLAAVFFWWPAFLRLVGRLWDRRWGRCLVLAVGLGTGFLTVVLLVLSCKVAIHLGDVPQASCPTVIVLGCQVRGTVPSTLLYYRIQAAADYLEANPGAVAILSGGMGSGEDMTEAACMYETMITLGIDRSRLYMEDQSTNTLENLQFSKALIEREGLTGPVVIVSNSFHVCRALTMAEDLGLSAQGLAAPSKWYSLPTYTLREAIALVYYGLTK